MSFTARFLRYGRELVAVPPHIVFRKARTKARKAVSGFWQRHRDFSSAPEPAPGRFGKRPLVPLASLDFSDAALRDLPEIVISYSEHRFDLLGSGWVRWGTMDPSPGLEGHRYDMQPKEDPFSAIRPVHRREARRLWALIGDMDYERIDWQKDVKSGFRFSEARWYRDQPIGTHSGADIKVPWEIGRLQHLPQMALAAALLREAEPQRARALAGEFRAQVLDFHAFNPPRMGSQWTCTMDVGIRTANMILAFDLFNQLDCGDVLGATFEAELAQALRRHGRHIVTNLEWSQTLTSNHYLANICGLLFVAATLEATSETDAWLAFAVHELSKEFFKQFHPDGGNFEGSTSYHRLSLEMVAFSTALVLGLPPERLLALATPDARHLPALPLLEPDWPERAHRAAEEGDPASLLHETFFERLARAACFTVAVTKPTGEVPQIGDNDSGRFFRLTPLGEWITPEQAEARYANLARYTSLIAPYGRAGERYFDENVLKHHAAVGAVAGIIDNELLSSGCALEKSICSAMAGQRRFRCEVAPLVPKLRPAPALPRHNTFRTVHEDSDSSAPPLTEEGAWIHYPDTGLHIYRSRRVHLTVSAGSNGQNGYGGHAHNDKLSFELQVNGVDIARDPGTYLYTPAPKMRNLYRSSAAHHAPCPDGQEQNRWLEGRMGLFWMYEDSSAWLCEVSSRAATFALRLLSGCCIRHIAVEDRRIVVNDWTDWPTPERAVQPPFSSGYGRRLARPTSKH